MARCCASAGEQKWSYLHVDDCAAAYLAAMHHGKAGSIYHVGAPDPITARQMAQALSTQLSSAGDNLPVKGVTQNEAANLLMPSLAWVFSISTWMDVSKAKQELKWEAKPRKDLAEVIASAAAA